MSIPRTMTLTLAASALFLSSAAVAAETKEDAPAEEASGLAAGAAAPEFTLPVVNSFKETSRKWGPSKWMKGDDSKKMVMVSFFATWCEPCKKEMPELVRLYEAYKDQGLGVMLVSIDKGKDKRDEVVALAEENKVPFPVVHDRFQVVARRYRAERLPYMLMLGPDGVVKTVHVGYTEEIKASLEDEVRGHLGLKVKTKKKKKKRKKRRKKGKGK
jgi:thiol-disulfide isomerase/thioredoxin